MSRFASHVAFYLLWILVTKYGPTLNCPFVCFLNLCAVARGRRGRPHTPFSTLYLTVSLLSELAMFSFRRKSSKKEQDSPQIRTSPSLPQLSSPGIPWPENLVDVAAIRHTPPPPGSQHQGAVKTSLHGNDQSPIPFHKPFRASPGKAQDGRGTISSFYMSSPPSAFDNRKGTAPVSVGRYSQRRARVSPTFNLMVCGPPFQGIFK